MKLRMVEKNVAKSKKYTVMDVYDLLHRTRSAKVSKSDGRL